MALMQVRPFPAVVHPRHAREALAAADVAAWTGAYAIVSPEHRRLVEGLLAALAWGETGQAVLLNGQFGAGKSHLHVLLHLLAAAPASWPPLLASHPTLHRYAEPIGQRRLLVVHGSLDAYRPQVTLEEALLHEIAAVLPLAPAALTAAHRADAWLAITEAVQAAGHGGLLLLIDELSLFLAAKTPARREADAAFLQFLAGWTARAPLWLIGAVQRGLGDTGALRTHSWRQVEDRFRREALAPQALGEVLRDRLILRTDPAAVRQLVLEHLAPAADGLGYPAAMLHAHWPLHPETLGLLTAIAAQHLSPHRSAVAVLQALCEQFLAQDDPACLITPEALAAALTADLATHDHLAALRTAMARLGRCAADAPDPALTRRVLAVLTVLHLADRRASVAQLRALLFDGTAAPACAAISAALTWLHRRGAYLGAVRDADPVQEVYYLAVDDDIGAEAQALAEERRRACTPHDLRVVELALAAAEGTPWAMTEGRVAVSWLGSERMAYLLPGIALTAETVLRAAEAVRAGTADALVCCTWTPEGQRAWDAAVPHLAEIGAACWCWQPRPVTAQEAELWREYAAWRLAADDPTPAATPRARRLRQRCATQADDLRAAVAASIPAILREGHGMAADGQLGTLGEHPSGVATLTALLAPAFAARYPVYAALGIAAPSRAETKLLLAQVLEPGTLRLAAQSVVADLVERILLPLGCVALDEGTARLTPPAWEFLAPLVEAAHAQPLAFDAALHLLTRAPFGLTLDHARLVLFVAVRTGALIGLDGFLRPLPADTPWSRSDALVFIGVPPAVPEPFRALITDLAAQFGVAPGPWPLVCSQTIQALQQAARVWATWLPEIRAALEGWTAAFEVMPWGWQHTEHAFERAERLVNLCETPLEMLAVLAEDATLPELLAHAHAAAAWWMQHGTAATGLVQWPWPDALRAEAERIRGELTSGEACFQRLPVVEDALAEACAGYQEAYQRWHDELFGEKVVQSLRHVFDCSEFRVIKLLITLPLPVPEAALQCLNGLARARTAYCSGQFARLLEMGTCARCRVTFGDSSPMPLADEIFALARAALVAYQEVWETHPWMATTRARVPRAPEAIAEHVYAFLAWRIADGADALVTLLQPHVVAWLCRDAPPAGARAMHGLQSHLHGRELTLREAREIIYGWLNPTGTLTDDSILLFE